MNTFAKQPQVQQKALKKALKSPNIGKHGKRKETLLKEEVYKEVQDKILENANKLINAQIKIALTGDNGKPDPRVIEMLLNRVFGKPTQEVKTQNATFSMGQLLDDLEAEEEEENRKKMALQYKETK